MQASPRVPGGGAEMEQDVRQKDAHPLADTLMIRSKVYGARLNVAWRCTSSHAFAVVARCM